MAKDPVCKMDVSEEKASEKTEYKGKTYYFCAKGCKERFEKDPEKYIGKDEDWVKGEEGYHLRFLGEVRANCSELFF